MKEVFKFQMIWSDNPLTIAEVYSEHDALTFRTNPEWYEIKEGVDETLDNKEVVKKPGRPSKKIVSSEE